MKILFYTSYFRPYISGITIYTERLVSYLSKKNFITILTFQYKKNLPEIEHKQNIRIIRMPYLCKISKGFISPSSLLTYIRTVSMHDRIIVTLPNVEAFFLVIYARLCNKNIVSIAQCDVDLGSGFLNKLLSRTVSSVGFIQLLLSNKVVGFDDYIQSRWFYPFIKHKFTPSLPPVREMKIMPQVYQELEKKKGNTVWVGFVGRISREKGIEYLIEALSKINGNNEKQFVLVMIGPKAVAGEESYKKMIHEYLAKTQLPAIIQYDVADADLGAWYKSFDVIVTPSYSSTEAFGMTQAEAMLVGTPAIASNIPGVRLTIMKTGMGLLFEKKNSDQLAASIIKVVNQRKTFVNSGTRAKTRALFDHNKFLALWEKILL